LTAGTFEMKVASSDWAASTNFGGQGAIEFGTPLTMEAGSASGNISITLPENGNYRFHFNAADKTAPIVTVTKN
ncbi:hypothetical protein ACPV51_24120, partial [Vibrio astriarenae]